MNPNGFSTGYYFEYGTTSSYGSSTAPGDAGAGTATIAVYATLNGLTPGTTYHYRVVAVRGGTVAATGIDRTFTTVIVTPTVLTGGASTIGASTATVSGTVNPKGFWTIYRFDYGETSSYGSSTALGDAGAGVNDVSVSKRLTGLAQHTRYHYRLVAMHGGAVAAVGSDRVFTTQQLPVNTSAPAISGTPTPGALLTCSAGSWTAASSFGYQWMRDGVAIAGTTSSTLTPASTDLGHMIACRVTAANAYGSTVATTTGVKIVDLAPPQMTALKLATTTFKAATQGPSIVRKGRVGTQVSFTLSEKSTVAFTVEYLKPGHKAVTLRGSFKWIGTSGNNAFRFTGRFNGHSLVRGSYRLVAAARDMSGNLAKPIRVKFTIT